MTDAADPFMIRAHVPRWEASVADYRSASALTRARLPGRHGLRYGTSADETIDLYFPEAVAAGGRRPIHLFVHGGYWRSFSKEDYAFVADAVTAAGAIAAVVDYSLMPAARMDILVAQVRRAAVWLADNAAGFGGDARAISASGHSAGAHLASFLACRGLHEPDVRLPAIRSVLLVSGLYDLDPIRRSFLQPELQLTAEEAARWSPVRAAPAPDADLRVVVGAAETAPFHDQAARFADHLARAGVGGWLATLPGEDHMTIVRALGRPGTACARLLADALST